MKSRALIVDDEPGAREVLRKFLGDLSWIELAGEAADGFTAVRAINQLRPDVVFLDVRLPGLSGIAVLERVKYHPAVVFTTAFDEYAIAALQAGALDYLLKPFGNRQFLTAMQRVRQRLESAPAGIPVLERARELLGPMRPLNRLFVYHRGRILPVRIHSIQHIEACDDYVNLHAQDSSFLAQIPIGELEKRLDPHQFIRVHRSHIVNMDSIASLHPYDERRLLVLLKNGKEIIASRTGSRLLRSMVV